MMSKFTLKAKIDRPDGVVVEDIAIGAKDLGFDSRSGHMEHRRQQLASHYTLRRNTRYNEEFFS